MTVYIKSHSLTYFSSSHEFQEIPLIQYGTVQQWDMTEMSKAVTYGVNYTRESRQELQQKVKQGLYWRKHLTMISDPLS